MDDSQWIRDASQLPATTDPITKHTIPIIPAAVAALTGPPAGNICVLDIDNKYGAPFMQVLQWLETEFGISEETTLAVKTKSNGQHLYIQCDPTRFLSNARGMLIPGFTQPTGLDFRGASGYAVAPPTKGYTIINDVPPMQAPDKFYHWYFDHALAGSQKETATKEDLLYKALAKEGLTKGERNDILFKIGAKFAYTFHTDPEAVSWVHKILLTAAEHCKPPYRGEEEDAEVLSIAQRCVDWQTEIQGQVEAATTPIAPSQPWYDISNYDGVINHVLPSTEYGLVQRLGTMDLKLLWRAGINKWWYKDRVWKSLGDYESLDKIRDVILLVAKADAAAGANATSVSKLRNKVATIAGLEAVAKNLRTKLAMPLAPDKFQTNESYDWIGFTNGVLNVRTKEFLPELPEDIYSATAFDYEYHPEAESPSIQKFFSYMFQHDPELIDFIYILLGYILVSSNKDNKFFLFIGESDAGKSTLNRILKQVFGGNTCANIPPKTFTNTDTGSSDRSTSLKKAVDARLILIDEVGRNKTLDEDGIKRATGGDILTFRVPYADTDFEFTPRFTPIMVGNDDPPFFSAAAPALRRRLVKIPLLHAVTAEVRMANPTIEEDIYNERSGIFNLILEGAHKYLAQKDRIDSFFPASIRASTKQFFTGADVFREFVEDELIVDRTDSRLRTPKHNINAAFLAYQESFMQDTTRSGINIRSLNKRLRDMGCTEQASNNLRFWTGLRLRNPSESVNGMVLQQNNAQITNTQPIAVTFGQVYSGSISHDDNNQSFNRALAITDLNQLPLQELHSSH